MFNIHSGKQEKPQKPSLRASLAEFNDFLYSTLSSTDIFISKPNPQQTTLGLPPNLLRDRQPADPVASSTQFFQDGSLFESTQTISQGSTLVGAIKLVSPLLISSSLINTILFDIDPATLSEVYTDGDEVFLPFPINGGIYKSAQILPGIDLAPLFQGNSLLFNDQRSSYTSTVDILWGDNYTFCFVGTLPPRATALQQFVINISHSADMNVYPFSIQPDSSYKTNSVRFTNGEVGDSIHIPWQEGVPAVLIIRLSQASSFTDVTDVFLNGHHVANHISSSTAKSLGISGNLSLNCVGPGLTTSQIVNSWILQRLIIFRYAMSNSECEHLSNFFSHYYGIPRQISLLEKIVYTFIQPFDFDLDGLEIIRVPSSYGGAPFDLHYTYDPNVGSLLRPLMDVDMGYMTIRENGALATPHINVPSIERPELTRGFTVMCLLELPIALPASTVCLFGLGGGIRRDPGFTPNILQHTSAQKHKTNPPPPLRAWNPVTGDVEDPDEIGLVDKTLRISWTSTDKLTCYAGHMSSVAIDEPPRRLSNKSNPIVVWLTMQKARNDGKNVGGAQTSFGINNTHYCMSNFGLNDAFTSISIGCSPTRTQFADGVKIFQFKFFDRSLTPDERDIEITNMQNLLL